MKLHQALGANSLSCNCTDIILASANKWAMSSGVLKWYGPLILALFSLVGSKQILCFKLPTFSFPSTSTKLLNPWGGLMYWLQKLPLWASCQFLVEKLLSSALGLVCRVSAWGQYFDLTGYGMGDLESIQYPQKHLGSFVKSALCLQLTWEQVLYQAL